MHKPRKKNAIALLAGVAVAAAVTASAASLGGLNTQHLGANSSEVVAPVTDGVTVEWQTAYDAEAGHYVVEGFDLGANDSEIPDGAEVRITVTGAGEASLAEFVSTDSGASYERQDDGDPVPAHEVQGASVVIIGGGSTEGAGK